MALATTESAAVVIVLLGNISAWSKMIFDARKNGKNGSGKPCAWHTGVESRISSVETHKGELAKSLETLHTENRVDHQQIFADIKALSIAVAGAASSAAAAAVAASRKRGKA